MARPRVYVETSVFSLLVARPSRHAILAARQMITQIWWRDEVAAFDLFASEHVIAEATRGDPEMAERRMECILSTARLSITADVEHVTKAIIRAAILPAKSEADALHLALATVHSMDYLVTWNFKHLANASIQHRMARLFTQIGYALPVVCTPDDLRGFKNEA